MSAILNKKFSEIFGDALSYIIKNIKDQNFIFFIYFDNLNLYTLFSTFICMINVYFIDSSQ